MTKVETFFLLSTSTIKITITSVSPSLVSRVDTPPVGRATSIGVINHLHHAVVRTVVRLFCIDDPRVVAFARYHGMGRRTREGEFFTRTLRGHRRWCYNFLRSRGGAARVRETDRVGVDAALVSFLRGWLFGWEIRMGKQYAKVILIGVARICVSFTFGARSFSCTTRGPRVKKPGGSDGETGGEGAFDGVRARGHVSRVPV